MASASMTATTHLDVDFLLQKIVDALSRKSWRQKNSSEKTFMFSNMIQPPAADIAKLRKALFQGAKMISDQKELLSNLSAEAGKTAVAVLKQIGNLHWPAAGFLIVASVLERFEKISYNKKQCWIVLKRLNDLAKCLKELKDRSVLAHALDEKADEAIRYIVRGAIMCLTQMHINKYYKFMLISNNREDLVDLDKEILHFHVNLTLFLTVTNTVSKSTEFSPYSTAVGIEDQVEKITQYLDLQSDKPAIAVVVCGIGGIGKTTVTDTVFHQLQGYKTCKVSLNENVDRNPSVETLQAEILRVLTGIEHQISNYKIGQEEIKRTLHSRKEDVLLYIDNVLRREYVKEILPERLNSPNKFRLLLTALKRDVLQTVESCGIEHCEVYEIKPLTMNCCIDIICSNLGENRGCNEMQKISQIAEKCSGIPLVLEVVGGYLRKAIKYKMELDQALEIVLHGLEKGEPFRANTKDMDYNSKLMFAYDDLTQSAKDAFHDISIFFCGWNWDKVGWIVGEEELRALEEGALVKRIADKVNVHDVLIGISRKKSRNVRITSTKQLFSVLQDQKVMSEIKGIWLNDNKELYSDLSAEMLDKMHGSLRILALGGWTMIKGICKAKFQNLRFLQAGDVGNLPFDISMLDQLRFLDNVSGQHIGFNTPSQIPETLRVLRLCERSYTEKLEISSQFLANLGYLRSLTLQWFASLFELPEGFKHLTKLVELDLSLCANLFQLPKHLGDLKALQELKLSYCKGLSQLPETIGELQCLKTLNLDGCRNVKQLPANFGMLKSLRSVSLRCCESLQGLPESFGSLSSLQKLDLYSCDGIYRLPSSFGQLASLRELDLTFCHNLLHLPDNLGDLTSLVELSINCKRLLSLPSSIEKLKSLSNKLIIYQCHKMKDLPEEFCNLNLEMLKMVGFFELERLPDRFMQLKSLKRLSLESCKSLLKLPREFGKLPVLEELNLYSCVKLQELSSDFHCLQSLKNLTIYQCFQLKELPKEFCNLNLEMLELSDLIGLERLPDRFMQLKSLKHLSLESCKSLVKLPIGFGKLPVLEELNMDSCIKLQELSSDFHCLPSLKKLVLSRCVGLDGLWMETLVKMSSLDFVDITGSCRLEDRWMELSETGDCEILVNTDKDSDEDGRILKKAASMFFNDECSLFDCLGTPFKPSALNPNTTLILVFVWSMSQDRWKQLMVNIQGLLKDCIDYQIIYIWKGSPVSDDSIQERMKELNGTTLGLTCDSSKLRLVFHTLLSKVTGSNYIFRDDVVITTVVDKDGTKQFSKWKNITDLQYESNSISENYLRIKSLQEVPQDGNAEILRSLLVTEGKDFLLLGNSKQVSIDSLEGKVVLLLVSNIRIFPVDVSALKEMYTTASDKHKFEIVWMAIPGALGDPWGCFVRTAESMPWPAMRDPWSIEPAVLKLVTQDWNFQGRPMLVVVDEKGITCNNDVKRIVERWGMEAYPFSTDQIHKLRMAQWDHIKAKSSLEVLLETFECFGQVKKSMVQGQLICLYGGDPMQILDFTSKLSSSAVSDAVQIMYVGRKQRQVDIPNVEEAMHERNRQGMQWLSLSFFDAWKFWSHIEYLLEDLEAEGCPESLEKYRVSLSIYAENNRSCRGVWMAVVDQSGEVVTILNQQELLGKLQWWDKEGCEIMMQAITCGEGEQE